MIKNGSLVLDCESDQNSSIDPILLQEDSINMSELGVNPNHDDSKDSISSDSQLKTNINQLMNKAKSNELQFLQEFKNQLDNIPNVNAFTVGRVTVKENKVETSGEDTPDTSWHEEMTLLQKACYCQMPVFAQELLLNRQVYPNKTAQKIGTAPILLAAYHGDLSLIKLLYDNRADIFAIGGPRGKSILHILLDGTNEDGKNENENHKAFEKCLDFIFDLPDNVKNLTKIVNHADVSKNVPLHYATNNWDQRIISKLFEYGAMSSVGLSNLEDEQPISKINPNIIEHFLIEKCLSSNTKPFESKAFELNLDYSFVATNVPSCVYDKTDSKGTKKNSVGYFRSTSIIEKEDVNKDRPDSECLWALGESEAHKHLLTNPVISLFINLKWQKIAPIYSNYQRFLYFFYMILTWYIVAMFGGTSTRDRNAINPYTTQLCPIEEVKKPNDGQSDSSTGDAIIFVAFAFLVVWMLFNASGELTKAYRRYRIKKDKKGNFVMEAMKIIFLNYGPHWLSWLVFILLITYTVSLHTVLSVFLAIVIFMEVLQFYLYPSRHFKFIENWMELFIVLLTGFILWWPNASINEIAAGAAHLKSSDNPNAACQLKRILSAYLLVISWSGWIASTAILSYSFSIHVEMFKKVMISFLKVLLLGIFLIVAFAQGFFIMYEVETKGNSKNKDDEPYKNKFHNPFLAFLITTLWSIGEIDHEEGEKFRFDFTFYNFLANFFVLIFFFLIVLVFMNFLNGLAVSDVRELKEDAEIRNQILRIDIIYHTESLLLHPTVKKILDWFGAKSSKIFEIEEFEKKSLTFSFKRYNSGSWRGWKKITLKDNEHINVWMPGKSFKQIKKALIAKKSPDNQENQDTKKMKQEIKELNEKLNKVDQNLKLILQSLQIQNVHESEA